VATVGEYVRLATGHIALRVETGEPAELRQRGEVGLSRGHAHGTDNLAPQMLAHATEKDLAVSGMVSVLEPSESL
jgi:hypothetical protein